MPAARWAAVFRELGAWLPNAAITLSGGEPLLHPEIVEIVRAAADAGLRASLSTSGDPLTPDLARTLAASGVHGVNLSLDAFADEHDRRRGREGLFARALGMADYLKELRPEIVIAVAIVIHRGNLDGLAEFTEMLLAKREVDQLYFQALVNQRGLPARAGEAQSAPGFPDAAPAAAFLDWLQQRRAPTDKIRNSASQIDFWKTYFTAPAALQPAAGDCRVGDFALTILPDGAVRLCDFLEPLGHVADAPLRDLWRSPAAARGRDEMRGCRRLCNYLINCAFEDLHRPLFATPASV